MQTTEETNEMLNLEKCQEKEREIAEKIGSLQNHIPRCRSIESQLFNHCVSKQPGVWFSTVFYQWIIRRIRMRVCLLLIVLKDLGIFVVTCASIKFMANHSFSGICCFLYFFMLPLWSLWLRIPWGWTEKTI